VAKDKTVAGLTNTLCYGMTGQSSTCSLHSCGGAKGQAKSRAQSRKRLRQCCSPQCMFHSQQPKRHCNCVSVAHMDRVSTCQYRHVQISFHRCNHGSPFLGCSGACLGACTGLKSSRWDRRAIETAEFLRRICSLKAFTESSSRCRCLFRPCHKGRVAPLHWTSVGNSLSHLAADRLTACSEDGWHDGWMYVACRRTL
jgi:hypothetical protein